LHYYKFNIADWYLDTSHLSILEEAIYFRLINHYYSTEKPFKESETQSLLRRLRLGSESETVNLILKEFFTLKDGEWLSHRCEKEIKVFKKKAKVNKANGSKGGRPVKDKGVEDIPAITQTVSELNPTITLTTNHKPLTTNHKPIKEKNNICELIAHEYKEKFDGQLPMVTKLTDQRKASINGCIKQMKGTDHDFALLETWVKYFNHASRSDFLMGVKTDWKMDFDFLITKSKMLKIIEGKYDN